MNSKLVIIIAIAIIFGGSTIWLVLVDEDKPGNSANNNNMKDQGLPQSLDHYYNETTGRPFEYLLEMYELGESMMGIPVNLGQGDYINASESFEEFSESYIYSSEMVPQWQRYYNLKAVDDLGRALADGDQDAIEIAMGDIGETCSDCHLDTMTPVYYKYYWGDFREVNIQTPDGPLPWKVAKMYYLLMGFDGIWVNIKEGDQDGAQQSFELFDSMFDNMNASCLDCHDSEPRYYVSEDIQTMIDDMGAKIEAGGVANLTAANYLRYGIGDSCHRCHIIHMPPQYAKVDGK